MGDHEYGPGDIVNGHVLSQDGQWMQHATISGHETRRIAPAAMAATADCRQSLRESAESWSSIFWLLAVLSAIGVWFALGMTTAGAVGVGWALAALVVWLPAIAFFNIIRSEL